MVSACLVAKNSELTQHSKTNALPVPSSPRFRAPQGNFLQFVSTSRDFQKAPGAAEALRFLKNKGPNFWS